MPYFKACQCAYCGDNYAGWQRQKNAQGVQNVIEKTLSEIYDEDIKITGSGRTDAGVHALGQVFNFSSSKYKSSEDVVRGLNALLPPDISVRGAADVNALFHSGKSIISKTYEYRIFNSPIRDPFIIKRALWIKNEIDIKKLSKILSFFKGSHDFASFCVKKTKKENSVRRINYINAVKSENFIVITVNAGGFLHNMVRIIAGTALKILKDNLPEDTIMKIIEAKDRRAAGPTAPPYALYQKEAIYGDKGVSGIEGIPAKYLV